MFGALLTIIATYLLAIMRFTDITAGSLARFGFVFTLIIILTILFGVVHICGSKDKNFTRYEDNWQEDSIRVVRGILVCLEAGGFIKIIYNLSKNQFAYHGLWILLILIAIFNIVQIGLIDNMYSGSVRETFVDAFLMQIQDTRNALLVDLVIICCCNFTVVGFMIIVAFASIFLRWYS